MKILILIWPIERKLKPSVWLCISREGTKKTNNGGLEASKAEVQLWAPQHYARERERESMKTMNEKVYRGKVILWAFREMGLKGGHVELVGFYHV